MNTIARLAQIAFALLFGLTAATLIAFAAIEQDTAPLGGAVLMAVISAAFGYSAWKRKLKQPAATNRLADEAAAYFEHINATRRFPESPTARIISRADAPVLAACDARLLELKSDGARRMAATRIKIGNQPFYLGGSDSAATVSTQETDEGELAITPKTLLFVGNARSVDIPLAKITAVEMALDAVTISAQGRQRPLIFAVSNGLLWAVLIRNLMQLQLSGRELPPDAHIVMM